MSDSLAEKREKLKKKREQGLMMKANKLKKEKKEETKGARYDQETIDRTIANARDYNRARREEEEKQQLRARIDGSSPSKPKKISTIANFVGELAIPAKIRFAMYDKGIQTGEENPSELPEDDELVPEPTFDENSQPFRNVSGVVYW
jgi:hypothetical protein